MMSVPGRNIEILDVCVGVATHNDNRMSVFLQLIMRRTFVVLMLFTTASLAGCASASVSTSMRFQKTEAPSVGFAQLYVFRPGFTTVLRRDAPAFLINDKEVFSLAYESYTSLMLEPGQYSVSLKPHFMESDVWNDGAVLTVEADKTYFLAIWNNVDYVNEISFRPVMGATPLLIPLRMQRTRNTGINFELVLENEATPVLEGMSYVAPHQGTFDGRP